MEKIQQELEIIKQMLKARETLEKQILSFQEALSYLKVSKSFLYKLTSKGEITYFKPNGKLIYFKRSDLDSWMLQNENKSISSLENEVLTILKIKK